MDEPTAGIFDEPGVPVCINGDWLPYVVGVLETLALPDYWTDTSHTDGIEELVAALNVQPGECDVSTPATILRKDPNGCNVQWSTDEGATWNTVGLVDCMALIAHDSILNAIADGTLGTGGSSTEPTAPSEPGGCKTYHVELSGGSTWRCPDVVNPGDQITVSNVRGSYSDNYLGLLSGWNCPTGQSLLLGACVNFQPANVADPDQNAYHMELLADIAGTKYHPMAAPLTVPGGVSDADLQFHPNNFNMPGGAGLVTFDVEVCKNGWNHTFDFTADDGGWVALVSGGNTFAEWITGVGWRSISINPGNGVQEEPVINKDFGGTFHIDYVRLRVLIEEQGAAGQHAGVYPGATWGASAIQEWNSVNTGGQDFIAFFARDLGGVGLEANNWYNVAHHTVIVSCTIGGHGDEPTW